MDKIKSFKKNIGFWLSRKINYPLVCPDILQISITSRCNLRCKMCHIWENADFSNELALEEMKDVIKQAVSWGIKEVNLCGGEPLLSKYCFTIINYAKNNGLRVILTTNGTMITSEVAQQIVDAGVDIISISLDGATADVHDSIRGQPDAYNKIMQGIDLINRYKKDSVPIVVLILTISNDNIDQLCEYVYMAKRKRADALYFTSLVMDNVKLYSQEDRGDQWIKGERLKKLDEMIDKITLLQDKYYRFNCPSFPLIKKYFRRQLSKNDWVCFAGYRRFVLLPGGTIQMCGEAVGNIRQTPSIQKIWNSEKVKQRRKQIKKCRDYCLQDCHARQESATWKNIIKYTFGKQT